MRRSPADLHKIAAKKRAEFESAHRVRTHNKNQKREFNNFYLQIRTSHTDSHRLTIKPGYWPLLWLKFGKNIPLPYCTLDKQPSYSNFVSSPKLQASSKVITLDIRSIRQGRSRTVT